MSAAAVGEEPRQEIIIVRRNHDHDEGHHGGVWKIAFADFMTAMMCFFLVMWLINAANEQTKAAVASYFNPVKLIDRNSSKKGLEDLGEGPNSAIMAADNHVPPNAKAGEDGRGDAKQLARQDTSEESRTETHSDEHLFANPYAVLSEIAEETGLLQNISTRGDGGIQTSGPSTGAHGGEAYRDPFAPDFWSQQVSGGETAEGVKPSGTGVPASDDKRGAPNAEAPADAAPLEPLAKAEPKTAETPKAERVEGEPSAAAVKAADAIRGKLAEALEPGSKLPKA